MPENVRMALFVAGGLIVLPASVWVLVCVAEFALVNAFAKLTMRPGVRYDGWRWRRVRAYVLDRDDHQCVRCGASYRLMHVHHKRPVRAGGSYQTWNLETLCPNCHRGVHPWMA